MKNKNVIIYIMLIAFIFTSIILLSIKLSSWEKNFDVAYIGYTSDEKNDRLDYYEYKITNKSNKTLMDYYAVLEVKLIGGNDRNKKIRICEKIETLEPNEYVNIKLTRKKIHDYIKYNKYDLFSSNVELVNIGKSCADNYEKVLRENKKNAKKIVEKINEEIKYNKIIETNLDELEEYTAYYNENEYMLLFGKVVNIENEYSDILKKDHQILYLGSSRYSDKTLKIYMNNEIRDKLNIDDYVSIKANCDSYINSCYSGSIASEEKDELMLKYDVEEYLDYVENFNKTFFEFYGYSYFKKEYNGSNFIFCGKVRKKFGLGYKSPIYYKLNYDMEENFYFGKNICQLLKNNKLSLYNCTKSWKD